MIPKEHVEEIRKLTTTEPKRFSDVNPTSKFPNTMIWEGLKQEQAVKPVEVD